MRINRVDNVGSVSFQRKPNVQEMRVYTRSLKEGLDLLNKRVDIILHNSSAPSVPSENTGIGSLFSRTTAKKLIPFLRAHGITGIQQEPNGLRKTFDNSPYSPEASAKNIYTIPLEKLASGEYHNLLSRETFKRIVKSKPSPDNVDYDYVAKSYDSALREAYENFKKGTFLKPEFERFKAEHGEKLESGAIYRILNDHYRRNWTEWDGIDRNLYAPTNPDEARMASQRLQELRAKYQDEIDFYIFEQMLVERENQASNELSLRSGISIIGDSPVATPAADEWVNQNLFLPGKALGCPPDAFSARSRRCP